MPYLHILAEVQRVFSGPQQRVQHPLLHLLPLDQHGLPVVLLSQQEGLGTDGGRDVTLLWTPGQVNLHDSSRFHQEAPSTTTECGNPSHRSGFSIYTRTGCSTLTVHRDTETQRPWGQEN